MPEARPAILEALGILQGLSPRFAWHLRDNAEKAVPAFEWIMRDFSDEEIIEGARRLTEGPDSSEWSGMALRAEALEVRRINRQLQDRDKPLIEVVPEEERISPERHRELLEGIRQMFAPKEGQS